MKSLVERIIMITRSDCVFPFDSAAHFSTRPVKAYKRDVAVDPFPCYGHYSSLVYTVGHRVEAAFPIGFPPQYYLPEFEGPGRTNGFAQKGDVWAEGGKRAGFEPIIILWGKRIPPHPAMTRYLVAHEYGHVVRWWIEHKRGMKDESVTDFDREYMALRPGSTCGIYGGGHWHHDAGELIANDFRICVAGIEREFWPHPGFDHPDKLPAVQDFWEAQKAFVHVPDVPDDVPWVAG